MNNRNHIFLKFKQGVRCSVICFFSFFFINNDSFAKEDSRNQKVPWNVSPDSVLFWNQIAQEDAEVILALLESVKKEKAQSVLDEAYYKYIKEDVMHLSNAMLNKELLGVGNNVFDSIKFYPAVVKTKRRNANVHPNTAKADITMIEMAGKNKEQMYILYSYGVDGFFALYAPRREGGLPELANEVGRDELEKLYGDLWRFYDKEKKVRFSVVRYGEAEAQAICVRPKVDYDVKTDSGYAPTVYISRRGVLIKVSPYLVELKESGKALERPASGFGPQTDGTFAYAKARYQQAQDDLKKAAELKAYEQYLKTPDGQVEKKYEDLAKGISLNIENSDGGLKKVFEREAVRNTAAKDTWIYREVIDAAKTLAPLHPTRATPSKFRATKLSLYLRLLKVAAKEADPAFDPKAKPATPEAIKRQQDQIAWHALVKQLTDPIRTYIRVQYSGTPADLKEATGIIESILTDKVWQDKIKAFLPTPKPDIKPAPPSLPGQ